MKYLGWVSWEPGIGKQVRQALKEWRIVIVEHVADTYKIYGGDLPIAEIEPALKGEHLEREQ